MADVKISGLPASTLPLAGTEVLPLVQGGVTKKVASDDLTVKNVRSNATTGLLQITGPAAGTTRVMTTPNANFTVARTDTGQTFSGNQVFTNLRVGGTIQGATTTLGSNASFEIPADGTNRYIYMSDWFSGGSRAAGAIKLRGDGATADRGWALGVIGNSVANFDTGFSSRLSCIGGNDVTVDVGNLVIGTSGKGVSFNGKTLISNNTLTLAGTDSTTMTFPSTSASIARTDAAQSFTGSQTFNSVIKSASNGANANFYRISKSFSGAGTNVTVLQITVPATTAFIFIKASYINSRATFTNVGTSFAGEYYYAISRNGSGSDVVLDNNFGTKNWTGTSTTAGGTLNAISGTTTIVRNGAEANTEPQVVNINFLAQCTGGSSGFVLMSFEVSSLSSTEITIQ